MNLSEIGVIVVVAIAVFRPQRLPEIARTIGHAVRKVQTLGNQLHANLNEQIALQELKEKEEKAKLADAKYRKEMEQGSAPEESRTK